jgi:hypothetical protein
MQTLRRQRLPPRDRLLRAIAVRVAIIVRARLLEDLKSKEKQRREYRRRMVTAIKRLQAYERTPDKAESQHGRGPARLSGLPAAPGFGRGQAHLLQPQVSFALIEPAASMTWRIVSSMCARPAWPTPASAADCSATVALRSGDR